MAEHVHKRTEEMLPELEQLQRIGLFSPKEIKAIIKKRTAHEYKLVRRMKDKKDFLAYVQYEIDMLALIHKRRKRERYFFKQDEIEYTIVSRIHRLFKQMTFRWPHDMKLWMSHANFCIKWNKKIQLSKLCTKLLQMHGNKPKVWVLTAKWEIECGDSMDKGRGLFMQAIKMHPKSKKIWWEFFRSELLYAEKLRRRLKILTCDDETMESLDGSEKLLLNGEAAKIAYRHAITSISDDAEFHSKFLEITSDFIPVSSFAMDILSLIRKDLKDAYNEEPVARAALAKLHLNPKLDGVHYDALNKTRQQQECDGTCFQAFEEAIEEINTCEMWKQYIDCLIGLCEEEGVSSEALSDSKAKSFVHRHQQTLKVIHRAHDAKKIDTNDYTKVAEFLLNCGCLIDADKFLEDACEVKALPKLLLNRLETRMLLAAEREDLSADVHDLFKDVVKHTGAMTVDQQASFWAMWMQWSLASGDDEMVEEIATKISLGRHPKTLTSMHDMFLRWIAVKRGVPLAYEIFKSTLCSIRTPAVEQFKTMLSLLRSCPTVAEATVEACYEQTLRAYGTDDPELWLQYFQYFQERGGAKATETGKIYWRAMKNLKPSLTEKFIAGHTLLGAEISTIQ